RSRHRFLGHLFRPPRWRGRPRGGGCGMKRPRESHRLRRLQTLLDVLVGPMNKPWGDRACVLSCGPPACFARAVRRLVARCALGLYAHVYGSFFFSLLFSLVGHKR
ncbi:unnamed protein product, partial [Ectocarpus sp. 12 AP-2014]